VITKNSLNEQFFSVEAGDRKVYGVIHHTDKPKAIVISAHGLNGERVDAHRILVLFSRYCAQNGIVSVRFDFSGCGVTETEFRHSSIKRRTGEIMAVADHIKKIYPNVPIVAHGFSDGCRIVYDSYDSLKPDACLFWSPILLPSQADDADLSDVPWRRIEGERLPVKPFLGLWMGFEYIKEYGKFKEHPFEDIPIRVFRGLLDNSVNDSIDVILKSGNGTLMEIENCGHIYETRAATERIIAESAAWIGSVIKK